MEIWTVLPIIYLFFGFPIYLVTSAIKFLSSGKISTLSVLIDFFSINTSSLFIFIPTLMYVQGLNGNIVVSLWILSLLCFLCIAFYKKSHIQSMTITNRVILLRLENIFQIIVVGGSVGYVIVMHAYLNGGFENV